MKPSNNSNRIIIGYLVLQTIIIVILLIFGFNFLLNRDEQQNKSFAQGIQDYANSFKPLSFQGPKGDKGEIGDQGPAGSQGVKGDKGDKGDTGNSGQVGEAGQTIQGPQGETGATGAQGIQGEPAQRAEFRCNPETKQNEYKYPSDEDWTRMGSTCIPTEEGEL